MTYISGSGAFLSKLIDDLKLCPEAKAGSFDNHETYKCKNLFLAPNEGPAIFNKFFVGLKLSNSKFLAPLILYTLEILFVACEKNLVKNKISPVMCVVSSILLTIQMDTCILSKLKSHDIAV